MNQKISHSSKKEIEDYCQSMLAGKSKLDEDYLLSLSRLHPSVGYRRILYGADNIDIQIPNWSKTAERSFILGSKKCNVSKTFNFREAINNLTDKDTAAQYQLPKSIVYFIATEDGKFVKIGFTQSDREVYRRIIALQTGNPIKLKLVKTVPGAVGDEKLLHAFFRKQKAPAGNEWFKYSNIITEYIAHCRKWEKEIKDSGCKLHMVDA